MTVLLAMLFGFYVGGAFVVVMLEHRVNDAPWNEALSEGAVWPLSFAIAIADRQE